jgi:hypothetical protein
MAAITAAVIAGVGTAASVGGGIYQATQTPTGPGQNPQISKLPQDPISKAMREYEARMTIANQGQLPPSFQSVLATGGQGPGGTGVDPNSEKFPLIQPGLTPQEEAAFGFTDPRGNAIPYVSAQDTTNAAANNQSVNLTPQQRFFMAKEKAYDAHLSGQPAGPWASSVMQGYRRENQLNTRLGNVQANAGDTPTTQQSRRIANIQQRITNVQGRQAGRLGGTDPNATPQAENR